MLLNENVISYMLNNYVLRSYYRKELIQALNQAPDKIKRVVLALSSVSNASLTYQETYQVIYSKSDTDKIDKGDVSRLKKKCIEYQSLLKDWGIEATSEGLVKRINKDCKVSIFNPAKEAKKLG